MTLLCLKEQLEGSEQLPIFNVQLLQFQEEVHSLVSLEHHGQVKVLLRSTWVVMELKASADNIHSTLSLGNLTCRPAEGLLKAVTSPWSV